MTTAAASYRYDRRLLALSVALQLALGALFAHAYDARVFMTTGYLVATGRGPYSPLDLGAVFHHVGFGQLTTIGYPPPWPLVTGLAVPHDVRAAARTSTCTTWRSSCR